MFVYLRVEEFDDGLDLSCYRPGLLFSIFNPIDGVRNVQPYCIVREASPIGWHAARLQH